MLEKELTDDELDTQQGREGCFDSWTCHHSVERKANTFVSCNFASCQRCIQF